MTTYSQTIELVTGDTLPSLVFTILDSNTAASGRILDPNDSTTWAPIDITGATVRLRVREVGSTTITDTLTGSVISGPAGTVNVPFLVTTFPTLGTYEGELEITFASGGIQSIVKLIKFKVREEFD